MVKIKEEAVDIIGWNYRKEKDEYLITFRISGLELERRERILKRQQSGFLKSQGAEIDEVIEVGEDLHVIERYDRKYFENYRSLIPLAQIGIIPERLEPGKLEIELDLWMIEQDMKYRIDQVSKSLDELKNEYI